MSWLTGNKKNTIKILERDITKKYIITNRSNIKVNTLNIISVNECRWIVNVKDLLKDSYIIELYTLENKIVETNNDAIQDVANFNNLFKEVYNELILEITFTGELVAVKNNNDIRRKWSSIKDRLQSMQQNQQSVATVINLNDGLFNSDANILEVIKATEFFELFFIGFYGKEIPANHVNKIRASKFRGAKLEWVYHFHQNEMNKYDEKAVCDIIDMRGFTNNLFTENFIKEAYGQFDFLNYKKLRTEVVSEGKYFIDRNTGMIEKGFYNTNEIIDEDLLYSKNSYTIDTY